MPDAMSFEDGAGFTLIFQTAWFGLHRRAKLLSGEVLLVHAGAGGVGSAAIQVGKAAGAMVIATAGSDDKTAVCLQLGADYAITGGFDARLLVVSIPVGLLVTAILHGNEWRDITEDTRYGFSTLSSRVGRANAHWIYVMLVLGAYVAIGLGVMVDAVPKAALLTLLSLPLVAWVLRSAELGAAGNLRAIAKIDLMTARLHSAFGALLVVGLLAASSVR